MRVDIVIYAPRCDKFQYIVPDRKYSTFYDFFAHLTKNRVQNEYWTAAIAKQGL